MLEEQGRRVGSVDKEKGGSPEGGGVRHGALSRRRSEFTDGAWRCDGSVGYRQLLTLFLQSHNNCLRSRQAVSAAACEPTG